MEPAVFSVWVVVAGALAGLGIGSIIVIQCFSLSMMSGMKKDIADLRSVRQCQAHSLEISTHSLEITTLKSRVDKLEGKG
jgi:hypothetical protein